MRAREALLWFGRGAFWILVTVTAAMLAVGFAAFAGFHLDSVRPEAAIFGVVVSFVAMWILALWAFIWVRNSRQLDASEREAWNRFLFWAGPISAIVFLFKRLHRTRARLEPPESQDG